MDQNVFLRVNTQMLNFVLSLYTQHKLFIFLVTEKWQSDMSRFNVIIIIHQKEQLQYLQTIHHVL